MSGLHVSIEQFEGPLALLLYLIRKEEMDIYNIPIHRITQKYLEHIQMMKKLDLEVASDFITMAATLIHIKSKMLLPQYNEENEDVIDDPRKDLVQRLVEYQRYQNASKDLLDRAILGRDVWRRGFKEDILLSADETQDIELDENGLFGLIATFRSCVKAAQKRIHKVMKKGQSVASRIMEIRDLLIPGERKIMRELIQEDEMSKNKLLVTFLSLLELAKMGFVRVFQSEPYADIHVESMRVIDRDVIQRVESYEPTEPTEPMPLEPQIIKDQTTDETVIEESATDDDIITAEKELGLDAIEGGPDGEVISSMEPIEEMASEYLKDNEV